MHKLKPDVERLESGLYWDRAWSLVEGCTPVSEGCDNCWSAMQSSIRQHQTNPFIKDRYSGLTNSEHRFNGVIKLMQSNMSLPMHTKKPYVWAIWNDLYHEKVPAEFIHEVYDVMQECPQHLFLVVTKRPERIIPVLYLSCYLGSGDYLPNVYHIITCENDKRFIQRSEHLKVLKDYSNGAFTTGISIEPMLDRISLPMSARSFIDWIIIGGETGHNARIMQQWDLVPLIDEARHLKIPIFFKRWGEWVPYHVPMVAPDFKIMNGITGKEDISLSDYQTLIQNHAVMFDPRPNRCNRIDHVRIKPGKQGSKFYGEIIQEFPYQIEENHGKDGQV